MVDQPPTSANPPAATAEPPKPKPQEPPANTSDAPPTKGLIAVRGSNGIYLVISVTPTAVPDSGKPATLGMGADESSTVTVDANQTGGVIRFAHLVPLTGADYTGEAMDLSGRIEFLCDAPPPG